MLQGVLDSGVGVEHDLAGRVVDQAGGQRQRELPAPGLGQDPAAQPGADQEEFSFLCGLLRYADHEL